jgi:hypothetical protein
VSARRYPVVEFRRGGAGHFPRRGYSDGREAEALGRFAEETKERWQMTGERYLATIFTWAIVHATTM